MHIETGSTDQVTTDEPEYEEVVEEYKEKILVQEEIQEPLTDSADTEPAQGKPRCMISNSINSQYICLCITLHKFF